MIIFAASIQYFDSLDKIISSVIRFLKPGGEIHIIDSKFYNENEIFGARERTRNYYDKLGFPGMSEYYFHHSWNELDEFNYHVVNEMNYMPSKLSKLFNRFAPIQFPWIVIHP